MFTCMAVSPVSLSSRIVGGPSCTVNLEEWRMSFSLELAVLLHNMLLDLPAVLLFSTPAAVFSNLYRIY